MTLMKLTLTFNGQKIMNNNYKIKKYQYAVNQRVGRLDAEKNDSSLSPASAAMAEL
jgi:hypothetical protein